MTEKPTREELENRVSELLSQRNRLINVEAELSRNLRFTETLLSAIPTPIFFKDAQGRYQGCNPAFTEIMGVTSQEISDKTVMEIWPSEFAEVYHQKDLELMRRPAHQVYEFEVKDKHGTIRPVIFYKNAFYDEHGNVEGLVGGFVDITERKQAEKALIEGEKRYHELFAANPHPMWVYDIESLAFLEVNSAAISHYGYSQEEFLSMTIKDIRPAEDVSRLLANIAEVNDGLDEAGMWHHIKKDGSVIAVEIISHALMYKQRRAEMVLVHDITDRNKAEIALKKNERKYRQLFERSNDAIFIVDKSTGRYLDANAAAEKLTGYPVSALKNLTTQELTPKGAKQRLDTLGLSDGNIYFDDVHYIRKNGSVRIANLSIVPLDDDAVFGIANDITERKVTEEELQKSEKRLQAIFEANPDPVVVYNSQGYPQYLNPAFTAVFGYSMDELKGQRIPFVPEDQKEITAAKIEEVYGSGKQIQFLSKRLTKQGNTLDVIISAAVIKENGAKGSELVVNLTDISEQMKLEAQLQQAQKMESVGRLAGGVAHDFNNMLGVIIGHTELVMEQTEPSSPMYDDLKEIYNASRRSADLTRQLLAFARKQMAVPKVIDLNDTIAGMLRMLQRLIGEDIDLAYIPGSNLWPVKIDPAQVDQIMANLSVNARDAIDGVGKLTIETKNIVLDQAFCARHRGFVPGYYALIKVSDDGCGMDNPTLENLFEPFFTTKEVGEGTGLGMSTVYGIIKQNDGFIDVCSQPGQGATFKIYLPRTREVLDVKEKPGPKVIEKGTETVLLVEDEATVLRLGKSVLERFGYTVLAAQTPAEALSIAEACEGPIHLMVTDVVMPKMNGKELKIRIEKLKPKVKVMFMSGYTADEIMQQDILDNSVHFLPKPFSVSDLAGKVREILDKPKYSTTQ